MRVLAIAALLCVVLAGCSDKSHAALPPVTCPDGSTVEVEGHDGHHEANFSATGLCPVPPTVGLADVPANATAYVPATLTWTIDAGGAGRTHAMLTSLRVSTTPADPAALAGPDSFGAEVAKQEHQDVDGVSRFPASHTFAEAGTYYLRAYAIIEGKDVWSNESAIVVTLAPPTGTTVTATKAVGLVAGGFTASAAEASLGDALVVANDDVIEYTFTWTEAPAGAARDDFPVAAGADSEPYLFVVPGLYELSTGGQQPKSLRFDVSA